MVKNENVKQEYFYSRKFCYNHKETQLFQVKYPLSIRQIIYKRYATRENFSFQNKINPGLAVVLIVQRSDSG